MDKVFNLEIDGQITLPDGSKLGPFYETSINIVRPSSCDCPSDLPKPSVGGYGYTESGVETILVDNESVTIFDYDGVYYGRFKTSFDIVDGAYTVIFNGTEYNLNSAFDGLFGFYLGDVSERGPDFSRYPFLIVNYGQETQLYTESAGDYEVTIKVEQETVHKIDEKYLPQNNGAMIVTVEYSEDDDGYVADKTFEEIKSAINSGMDIKCVLKDHDKRVLLNLSYYSFIDMGGRK